LPLRIRQRFTHYRENDNTDQNDDDVVIDGNGIARASAYARAPHPNRETELRCDKKEQRFEVVPLTEGNNGEAHDGEGTSFSDRALSTEEFIDREMERSLGMKLKSTKYVNIINPSNANRINRKYVRTSDILEKGWTSHAWAVLFQYDGPLTMSAAAALGFSVAETENHEQPLRFTTLASAIVSF